MNYYVTQFAMNKIKLLFSRKPKKSIRIKIKILIKILIHIEIHLFSQKYKITNFLDFLTLEFKIEFNSRFR